MRPVSRQHAACGRRQHLRKPMSPAPLRAAGEASRGDRIAILDGFRAFAIALVIGFHYFSRWTPPRSAENLYPYGDWLAHFPLFNYGYLGVQLFFIVSGFVISMTLLGCRDWYDFAWKRFARLFPTMLLCSTLSFLFVWAFPTGHFSSSLRDFLPSLTFSEPDLWSRALGLPFRAIDSAYWSLQVEVKFYFWAAVLFFVGQADRFVIRFTWFFVAVWVAQLVSEATDWRVSRAIVEEAWIPAHLPWFAAGVGFHSTYHSRGDRTGVWLIVLSLLVLVLRWFTAPAASATELLFSILFFGLFTLFVKRPNSLAWFGSAPMVAIGAASYSLYLLHQDIGVTVLSLWAASGVAVHSSAWLAVAVAGCLIALSVGIYRFWEMPAKGQILRWRRSTSLRAAA